MLPLVCKTLNVLRPKGFQNFPIIWDMFADYSLKGQSANQLFIQQTSGRNLQKAVDLLKTCVFKSYLETCFGTAFEDFSLMHCNILGD